MNFFHDTFDGAAGAIAGRTPDTPFGGLVWTDGETTGAHLDGTGYIGPQIVYNSETISTAAYGAPGAGATNPSAVAVTFSMRTGANVGLDGIKSHFGVTVYMTNRGVTTSFRVWGLYSSGTMTWYANINGGDAFVALTGITADTEYAGRIELTPGQQKFFFLGEELTTSIAPVNADGVEKVELWVSGNSRLGSLSIEALGAQLTAPSPTLGAAGTVSIVPLIGSAAVEAEAPAPVLSVKTGASALLSGPRQTLGALAHDSSGEQSATLLPPAPTLAAWMGATGQFVAPRATLLAAATTTSVATATATAPPATLGATGQVSGMANVRASVTTPFGLVGYGGAVCSVSIAGRAEVLATGTTGSVGVAALVCPLFELGAAGTAQNYGSADILAPSPRMGQTLQAWLVAPGAQLVAIGTAVVAATYEAYAVNLRHAPRGRGQEAPVDEVSRYTNFPFTHIVRHKNSYYGANSTGLYLLEGTTDAGAPVAYAVRTALTDFKSPTRKTVASVYFGGRLGPEATLTLHAGEGAQAAAYSYTTPRGALAQNHRQAFGRGIRQHRYYAIGIAGEGAMELDGLELNVHNSTRRI